MERSATGAMLAGFDMGVGSGVGRRAVAAAETGLSATATEEALEESEDLKKEGKWK